MKRFALVRYFNWRILLLRVLVNAGALLITAAILPNIYFVDRHFLTLLWMALVLGVLNALVKPVIQFLTLSFIFATYGAVIVLINAGLLWLLSFLFPSLFAVNGLPWALLGGLVMGLLGSFLESLLGVTPPIVPEKYRSLRQQISSQPQPLQTILAQAAPSGKASAAPVGAPSSPESHAAGAEDISEPVASDKMAAAGAGPGAPPMAPTAGSTESEG